MTPPKLEALVEKVARLLHFDFVDQHGYPNGLPTWDELPDKSPRNIAADLHAREAWRSLAEAAIETTGITLLMERREALFDAIAHGDDNHRAWLKEAIDAHFAGEPVPEPRGKGTTEALMEREKRLESALLPFAELAGDVNMNDPLSKWIRVGHLHEAREAIRASLTGGEEG